MYTSILSRQDLPQLITTLPGPKARAIVDRDHAVLSPSNTRSYPLVIAKGEGAVVEDVDGNRFLDLNAGIAVCSTGHCHPQVVAAIREQAGKFLHMSGTDFYYENIVTLGEKLNELVTGGDPTREQRRVYYGNSGAEAVEAALKMARYHSGRDKFIAFFGAFHGRTMGALSLTGSRSIQKKGFAPLLGGVTHIPYAYCYRCPYGKKVESCNVECVKILEDQLFKTTVPAEEVAAIFVEAVQGEGGYVVPPQKFIHELQEVAHRHGILVVFDEVQSGMGRTGKMFAHQHFGVDPDIITLAKGIASGMPLCATVAKASYMQWKPGSHASTFGGNPVSVAAALVTIQLLEQELVDNAALIGARMKQRMLTWPARFPIVGDVRGLGLMLGFEIVRDQVSKEKAQDLRDRIVELGFQKGILILGAGQNSIRLAPPLVISADQADFALDTLEECLLEVCE